MRLGKFAFCLITAMLMTTGNALAQNEIIARAYRTVNVRSGPGTQYDIIGQLNSGNEVLITGRSNDESDWLRIDYLGRDGWVAYFTVTVLGDASQLSVVTARATQSSESARPAATPMILHALNDVYVSAYRRVNVRSGPGSSYVSIGNLEAGSTVDVTGRSDDNVWLRIDYAGHSGWVAYFAVSLTGTLDAIQIVGAEADAATEEPAAAVEIITRYNVNLHEEPTLASPVVAIIPYEVSLQAESRSDSTGTWLRVTYRSQTGWLLSALVSVLDAIDVLPVQAA